MKRSALFPFGWLPLAIIILTGIVRSPESLSAQSLSGEKSILSYSFLSVTGSAGVIDQTTHTITVTVPFSVSRSSLIAVFTLSPYASAQVGGMDQTSGATINNFETAVVYSVIAEDASVRNYVVSVANAPASSACNLTSFSFPLLDPPVTGVINPFDRSVSVTVPYGTPLDALVAAFSHSPYAEVTVGSTVQESGVTPNNFTSDVEYLVTAENGSDTREYTVSVEVTPAARGNSFLTFAFLDFDPDVIGTLTEATKSISLTVPYGTNVTGLVASFTTSPFSTVTVDGNPQTSGETAQDFTSPVAYKCIAQDGSEEIYTVSVSLALPSTANRILSFGFSEDFDPDITGSINEPAKTIALTVPFSSDLTALRASFTSSPLSAVLIDGIPQVSDLTVNDFTNPVPYTCMAQDGSTEIYTVTVSKAPVSTGNSLLAFDFPGLTAPAVVTINQTARVVNVAVPYSTTLGSLAASFTASQNASVTVLGVPQKSGITVNDFSATVVYTLTAENGNVAEYQVVVSKAPAQTGREFTSFRLEGPEPDVDGFIDPVSHTILLVVPATTPLTNLVATFTVSPLANVFIGPDQQISGVTANNFTTPRVYRVRAESGAWQDYTVTVSRLPQSSARAITDFRFTAFEPDAVGLIDPDTKTIRVNVPYPADVTNLVASFENSPLSTVQVGAILQTSGVTANDFSSGVVYDVYAEDGSLARYSVLVTLVSLPKRFLSYSFQSQMLVGGDIVGYTTYGVINEQSRTISAYIPFNASKTSLAATFSLTPGTIALIGSVPQVTGVTANDFTNPKTYVLQANDGSVTSYEVTVSNSPASQAKQIVSFRFNGLSPSVGGVINETNRTIMVQLPFGTSLSGLVATFSTTSDLTRVKIGGVRQYSGVTSNNFATPQIYRCLAEDGSFVDYTVTATVLPASPSRQISDFRFKGLSAPAIGTIDESAGTIHVVVPWGADVTRLVASFTASPLSEVSIGVTRQVSGLTVNDFTNPVTYSVRAQNGTIRTYQVTVERAEPSAGNTIISFGFTTQFDPDIFGTIDEEDKTIQLIVPYSQPLTSLVATFVTSPYASLYIGAQQIVSGVTAIDYSMPVTCACRAENGSISLYSIEVTHAPVSTANELLTFRFGALEPDAIGVIDPENFSVVVRLPFSQPVNALVADFALSPLATAYVGGVLQTSGLTANNYTSPVIFSVRSESGAIRNYHVSIVREAMRTGRDFESFSFQGLQPAVNGVVDPLLHTISARVPFSTDLTRLIATWRVSYLASVRVGAVIQVSGVTSNDFSTSLVYTVESEDGGVQPYLITVTRDPVSSANLITDFRFTGLSAEAIGTIDQETGQILVTVPWASDVSNLAPVFSHSAASVVRVGGVVQVSGQTTHNFSVPVTYEVTAENGTLRYYSVIVSRAPAATGNAILDFSFNSFEPDIAGAIDPVMKTITLTVPHYTDVTGLVASFTLSPSATLLIGPEVQESGATPNNFTHPLVYTCRAEDGSTELYTVTVLRAPASNAKQMLSYRIHLGDTAVEGSIEIASKNVAVTVPFGTDLSYLIASFTLSPLASAEVSGIRQVSGETPLDFSRPVTYRIIAEDNSEVSYLVTVTIGKNTENRMLAFGFESFSPAATGVIDDLASTIRITVPFGSSVNSLIASFEASANATVKIGTVVQASGVTANNFTSPKSYVVTSESGAVRTYTVTVTIAPPSSGRSILTFGFEQQLDPDIYGAIDPIAGTIRLVVPLTQDLGALVATFTSSPYSKVRIGSVVQVSGVTANNFTNPVDYVCEAQDGTLAVYRVTVTRAPASSQKDLLGFRFEGLEKEAIGVIDPIGRVVTVTVPGEADRTRLVANFQLSPYAVARVGGATQISGVTPNDFTLPVRYTIQAEDNSEKVYLVNVMVGPKAGKRMLSFGFSSLPEPAAGVINEAAGTIIVQVPFSTNRAALVADFTSSELSTVWMGTTRQISGLTVNDFNSVRTYTVKAEDLTTKDYQVSVLKNPPSDENRILSFAFNGLPVPVQGQINDASGTIELIVPFGTSLINLVATFSASPYAAVTVNGIAQISGFTPNNFNLPVTYRCTSESGLIREYRVQVTHAAGSSEKEITYFAFEELNPPVIAQIDPITLTIRLQVLTGTSVNSLRASFLHSAGSIVWIEGKGQQISGVTPNDFTLPLIYRVIAEDASWVEYTVTVELADDTIPPVVTNPAQLITNASGQFAVMQSSEPSGKVYMVRTGVPQATPADLDFAVATGKGRSAVVLDANVVIQVSTYALEPGVFNTYAVDVAGNQSDRGVNTITVLDALPPDVFVQAQTVSNGPDQYVNIRSSDASGFVYLVLNEAPRGDKSQLDAAVGARKAQRNAVQFANTDVPVSTYQLVPGEYRAIAVDASGNLSAVSTAVVTVTRSSHLKSVLAYSFNGIDPPSIGQIVGTDIFIKVPTGTPLEDLVATFSLSPLAKAFVGLVQQQSGITPNNFVKTVVYTVEAEDGTTQDYRVSVSFGTYSGDTGPAAGMQCYPNPVQDRLVITLDSPVSVVAVCNIAGQVIWQSGSVDTRLMTIDTAGWQQGIYFIRFVREGMEPVVRKVVKE